MVVISLQADVFQNAQCLGKPCMTGSLRSIDDIYAGERGNGRTSHTDSMGRVAGPLHPLALVSPSTESAHDGGVLDAAVGDEVGISVAVHVHHGYLRDVLSMGIAVSAV